ncbi:hypothetical protein HAHE_19870 [Haloferula helveola]|uniref:DUF5666 domain-containing protein n=1 Tax=Haloferula helveola TaxID=490095 RepID=A0ABM7RFZ1_9BACT|nr:hypothetical protein HAHE_19870 [Haloferula helveola]
MKTPTHFLIGLTAIVVLASTPFHSFAGDQPSATEHPEGQERPEHPEGSSGQKAPKGLIGFVGQVRGVVVKNRDDQGVEFKVIRVIATREDNKAQQPKLLEGRTVSIGPNLSEEGKWNPVERQIKYLRTLKPGEELTLDLGHAEREHFVLLRKRGPWSGKER